MVQPFFIDERDRSASSRRLGCAIGTGFLPFQR